MIPELPRQQAYAGWTQRYIEVATACVALLCSLALLGWAWGIPGLRTFGQPVAMNPVVAGGFLSCCLALWLRRSSRERTLRQRLGQAMAGVVAVIGLAKLAGYVGGFDVAIDRLLFPSQLTGNRMAPNTALCLMLMGAAVSLLDLRIRQFGAAPFLALAAAGVALLALAGYLYAILSFYGVGHYIPMALNTALAIMLLSGAILCSRPDLPPTSAILGRWSVERSIAVGFIGALLMLCLISLVSYHTAARVVQDNADSAQAGDSATKIEELGTLMADAETGQRGYLLTGDEQYLEPCNTAAAQIEGRLTALRAAVAGQPEVAESLTALEPLVRSKLAELRQSIQLRRTQGFEPALALVRTGEGQQLTDDIRRLVADAVSHEQTRARLMTAGQDLDAHRTVWTIMLGTLTTVILVLGSGILTYRGIRAQRVAESSLREREQEYRASFELAGVGKIQCDVTGRLLRVNAKFCEMTGYSAEELLSKNISDLTHPDDRASDQRHFEQLLRGDVPQLSCETRLMCKDGRVIWAALNVTLVRDEAGCPMRTVGMVQDVTERRRTAELREEAAAAARAANEAKSLFLANMSHEIRTPMSAILGYTDMLLELNQTDAERIERVRTIRSNADHLLSVLNDILDLSKIEAGKMEFESIPSSPHQIINETVSLMRVRAVEKHISLNVTFAGPIPQTIQTDPTRLRQILLNLIGNAIKFTDTGGVHVVVTMPVEESQAEPVLEFAVIDSGIGINPDQLQNLFQPFQQLDSSTTRRFGGTGLGLTICRRLAELLGGSIAAQSRPGTGSRFTLRVRTGDLSGVALRHDSFESLGAPTASAPEPSAIVRLRGRVLLAEDGTHNQRVICFYLQKAGLQVEVVDNGRLACEAVSAAAAAGTPFDVVLMDMQMPEMDGYTAAATLRARGFEMPVVALTAHAMSHDRARCIQSGCTDYLTKPIDRELLVETLARYLAPPALDAASPQPLRSEMAEQDGDVARLLCEYVADLPRQVAMLLRRSSEGDLAALRTMAHQMTGTAGMYGFAPITDAASELEQRLDAAGDLQAIDTELRRLIQLIRRVDGYDPAREADPAPPTRSEQ